jgi:hypothetical protein
VPAHSDQCRAKPTLRTPRMSFTHRKHLEPLGATCQGVKCQGDDQHVAACHPDCTAYSTNGDDRCRRNYARAASTTLQIQLVVPRWAPLARHIALFITCYMPWMDVARTTRPSGHGCIAHTLPRKSVCQCWQCSDKLAHFFGLPRVLQSHWGASVVLGAGIQHMSKVGEALFMACAAFCGTQWV